jgi:hypothetical protein
MADHDPIQSLTRELVVGQVNRREFIKRAVALGLSASAVAAILAACGTTTPTATTARLMNSRRLTCPTTSSRVNDWIGS